MFGGVVLRCVVCVMQREGMDGEVRTLCGCHVGLW
jgi:hypothetical protein